MKKLLQVLICVMLSLTVFLNPSFADTSATVDLSKCKPVYPKAALMNEEQGAVLMSFVVGADGKVVSSKVEKSSGSKSLDRAALNAISECTFKPGSTGKGALIQTSTSIEYIWKLD